MRSAFIQLAGAALLAACAPTPPPVVVVAAPVAAPVATAAAAPAPMPASNRRARVCEIGRVGRYRDGGGTISPMRVSNEGGWCRHNFGQENRKPFTSGDIVTAPEHGEARIRNASRTTRIEYRPMPGYVGSDRFVATLTPGGGTYIIEVTVAP